MIKDITNLNWFSLFYSFYSSFYFYEISHRQV
jgi:hypothetical protein